MGLETHVAQVCLSEDSQERVGLRVNAESFSLAKRLALLCIAIAHVLIVVLGSKASPPPPYLAGFFSIGLSLPIVLLLLVVFGARFDATFGRLRYRIPSAGATGTWITQVPLFGPLTGASFAVVAVAFVVYSVCFVVVGIVQNDGIIWGAAPRSAWFFGAFFAVASVYSWRDVCRAFRANIGVRLAPDRVGIHHEHSDLFLQWREIERVAVEMVNKGTGRKKRMVSCVRIEAQGSRVFHIEVSELGSDPNVVAALMQYYLERPQERDALADPEEAIRRFRDAQLPTPM